MPYYSNCNWNGTEVLPKEWAEYLLWGYMRTCFGQHGKCWFLVAGFYRIIVYRDRSKKLLIGVHWWHQVTLFHAIFKPLSSYPLVNLNYLDPKLSESTVPLKYNSEKKILTSRNFALVLADYKMLIIIRNLKIRGRRRQRKLRWKSEFAFFQSSSWLLRITNFVKCRQTLLKLNS